MGPLFRETRIYVYIYTHNIYIYITYIQIQAPTMETKSLGTGEHENTISQY